MLIFRKYSREHLDIAMYHTQQAEKFRAIEVAARVFPADFHWSEGQAREAALTHNRIANRALRLATVYATLAKYEEA